MKLLVGLGNPGSKYRDTRHNVGFLVIDELARRWLFDDMWKQDFNANVATGRRDGERVGLVKPLTFMNESGAAVAQVCGFYRVEPTNVLVVTDDVALPLGRLRARRGGSAGGHNGLKSVIQHLSTQEFPRLRIGVGRGDARRDLADHVLARFDSDERDTVEAAVLRAADAAEMFVVDGIERVMNAFNAATDSQQDSGSA